MYRLVIGAVRVTIRWSPGQSVPRAERALTGWQSGLLWANWRPKPSYYRVRDAVFGVRRRQRRLHAVPLRGSR